MSAGASDRTLRVPDRCRAFAKALAAFVENTRASRPRCRQNRPSDESPRIPIEGTIRRVRHSRAARATSPRHRPRPRRRPSQARRRALGRQGPGPRGRPRQGRRRQARAARRPRSSSTRRRMLGTRLVTHQTGPEGLPVDCVYVESGSSIERELYLSLVVDRSAERIAIMASAAGGMDIEEVAARHAGEDPHADAAPGRRASRTIRRASSASASGSAPRRQASSRDILRKLAKLFRECDASLVEVNPLIVTKDGHIVALDAKINIEDNALFRQQRAGRDARRGAGRRARARARTSTTSTTSRWTATSPAWSTAPASRWRRWTSSSCTAASPRTSSTSAAAPRPSA